MSPSLCPSLPPTTAARPKMMVFRTGLFVETVETDNHWLCSPLQPYHKKFPSPKTHSKPPHRSSVPSQPNPPPPPPNLPFSFHLLPPILRAWDTIRWDSGRFFRYKFIFSDFYPSSPFPPLSLSSHGNKKEGEQSETKGKKERKKKRKRKKKKKKVAARAGQGNKLVTVVQQYQGCSIYFLFLYLCLPFSFLTKFLKR